MSLFEKLGLVKQGTFTDEPKPAPKKSGTTVVAPPVQPTPNLQTAIPSNTDYNKHLSEVLRAANLAGPDYLEFADALEKMNGQPLSDQQKYQSIFAILSSTGLKLEVLESSSNKYIQVLDKEAKDFAIEYAANEKTNATDLHTEADSLEKKNIELNQQIQNNNLKAQELRNKAGQALAKLAGEKAGFDNALTTRKNIISNHISNIKNYLNVTI